MKNACSACTIAVALLVSTPKLSAQMPVAAADASAQSTALAPGRGTGYVPLPPAREEALPLPEDRGAAALEQAVRRLNTTASALMIVAHPDDEDGALLTYLSRGLGARVTLLTLTRGEGGQNAMGGESYDALGLLRTNELLRADAYYGVEQLWGTEADFGFSKTQEESFARWTHERVLYDAVLAVRRVRPQVILSTFVGGVTDGHGHHQVAGEIAQEAFHAAADPRVFPEQLRGGVEPWQARAVYSMTPFAPVTEKGMFDYATGKWAAARFQNYVTGAWTEGVLPADVTLSVGCRDAALGRSYTQIAREGWGEQRSQYGGANPALSGAATTSYHLWAADASAQIANKYAANDDFFHNSKVEIDTRIEGLAALAPKAALLPASLAQIAEGVRAFSKTYRTTPPLEAARALLPAYQQTIQLRARIGSDAALNDTERTALLGEIDAKISAYSQAFRELLGLDVTAFTAKNGVSARGGPAGRGASADEMPRSVAPGDDVHIRVHATAEEPAARLLSAWIADANGKMLDWKSATGTGADATLSVHVPENAASTAPYFTRPGIEQPYYDLADDRQRLRSFAPYPYTAWALFWFEDAPIYLGEAVQTMARVPGRGGSYEPLVITPALGVEIAPKATLLPSEGQPLEIKMRIHAQHAASGTARLELPAGWRVEPMEIPFDIAGASDSGELVFCVFAKDAKEGESTIQAVVESGGHTYRQGWQSIGYAGLRSYNLYTQAVTRVRRVDAKLATGLRIGYIAGTGDSVLEAIESLAARSTRVSVHVLTPAEIASSDFAAWDTLVVGIRAYSVRPELAVAQPRLDAFVQRGGTLLVQYQSGDFPAPAPLALGSAERVVEENAPVRLLVPGDALLIAPNTITAADFDGWVEERGHGFAASWDAHYTALAETADKGQDAQRGGLLVGRFGKGTYIYDAFALHRQLPELVPGAYRLLANLLSGGAQ